MHTCMYDYITKGQEGEPENSSWVSEPAKTSNHREREGKDRERRYNNSNNNSSSSIRRRKEAPIVWNGRNGMCRLLVHRSGAANICVWSGLRNALALVK